MSENLYILSWGNSVINSLPMASIQRCTLLLFLCLWQRRLWRSTLERQMLQRRDRIDLFGIACATGSDSWTRCHRVCHAINVLVSSQQQLTGSDRDTARNKEEQQNHQVFSVYSANSNQKPYQRLLAPPEDTIKRCKCNYPACTLMQFDCTDTKR